MRRGCFIGTVGVLGLCVVCVALGYFVAIPRIRDSAQNGVRDAISTQVARQIPAAAGGAAPGAYTITAAELQTSLNQNLSTDSVNDLVITIAPSGFEFKVTAKGGQETTYTGVPAAENGRLVMNQMATNSDFLDFIFPAGTLGNAIEEAVNGYLAANHLSLADLTMADGEITLETVAAS